MTKKEAINILNHVIEYYDMNFNTGDKESTTEEISKAWDALDVVLIEEARNRK